MSTFTPPVVPAALASLRNWLVWRLVPVEGGGKPRKIPYYASGPARPNLQGTPEDRAQLVTFAEAVAAVERSQSWERPYTGVGFAPLPDTNVVALDFDNCVEDGVLAPHVEPICAGTYTEFSPSGRGVRAFFLGSLQSKKDVPPNMKGPWAIEVFGHNGFVTVTGNVTPTCEMFGWNTEVAYLTPAVFDMYRSRGWDPTARGDLVDTDGAALMAITQPVGMTHAQIAALLADLPTDLDYDTWLGVGQSVHQETQGSDEGFRLWDNWSRLSPKYTTEEYGRQRWKSFGRYTGPQRTMRSVAKMAADERAKKKYVVADQWRAKIAECASEFELRERLCPQIVRDDTLGEEEREKLAHALSERFRGLGTKLPIGACRKMVQPHRAAKARSEDDLPDWARGWVYVTDDDKFYNPDTNSWLTLQGFNATFNRFMPTDESGEPIALASWTCLNQYGLPSLKAAMYLPWAAERFEWEGAWCVNTYRQASVPQAADSIGPEGHKAIETVKRHLRLLCGDRPEVIETYIHFLAHNVQKPGVKIRWAPLLKGIEGDGKSLIGTLLACVMGRPNVKNISPKVLGTDFTGWATGSCVAVLEEIKLHGHNRHDILNALKPYVTNDSVPVHKKGKDEFDIHNTTNYIAFTNYADALPLTDTDRRWWIVFTPFASEAEMAAAIRDLGFASTGAYFDELHDAINLHRAQLRRWLLDVVIPSSFKPNGRAPATEEKALMIAMSSTAEEEIVREIIAEAPLGVSGRVLSSSCVTTALLHRDTEVVLQTTALNRVLTKLGWTKVPKRLKWREQAHTIWIKGRMSVDPDVLRAELDATASLQKTADSPEGSQSVVDFFN